MRKIIAKTLKACLSLSIGAVFFGCSMIVDTKDHGGGSSVRSVRSLMNRSDAERMLYMGGSVLYSPNDSNANQLAQGAVVATRIGKVIKKDLGCGEYAYQNSKTDYELGFITVDSISKERISFSYYRYPSSSSGPHSFVGSYSLSEGQTADLNGDGTADVKYTRPAPGRKGYKSNMWLTFICDVEESDSAAMFSIVPMQYSKKTYPNGLLGINTAGQYVVNKYNVGTNSRSLVSDISYGDYVLDTEANTLSRYVGASRNSRSAGRAIGDSELQCVEGISSSSTPADFEFKASEFGEEYDVKQLLSVMPSSMVTENYSGRNVAENVAYLNSIIRDSSFIRKLTEANPGDVANEINSQLAEAPISGDVERVLFSRHALTLMYPEHCPDVNLYSQSLGSALPWLYIDFGDVIQNDDVSDDAARSAATENRIKKEKQASYDAAMRKYIAEAEQKHSKEKGVKVDDYIEYEVKRDAIQKYFSTLKSYNILPLGAAILDNSWVKDFVKGTKLDLSFGVAGSISFANANPSIDFKIGVLVKVELENALAKNSKPSSLFADKRPEEEKIEYYQDKFNEKFPDGNFNSEDIESYIDAMSKVELPDDTGLNGWLLKATDKLQKASPVHTMRPTKDAKNIHRAFNPIPQIPLVVTVDAQFDIIFKTAAIIEFNNFTAGYIGMQVLDCKAGIDWGFRRKFWGIPVPSSFYCDTYAAVNRYSESAGFAGITTIDRNKASIGGGMRFTLCPIVEFRGGVGIGYTVLGAGADVTVGAGVDFWAPITCYIGMAIPEQGGLLIVTDTSMDVGVGIHGDVQFCLNPPIIPRKRWNYDIPGLKAEAVWQIFRLRTENFEAVIKEGPKRKS